MANWKFWQKKQSFDESELPEEVREYYDSTRSTSRMRNVIVGIIALLVTLLAAYLLYLAGSWVYNQFTEETTEQPETVGVIDTNDDIASSTEREQSEGDANTEGNESSETDLGLPENLPGDSEPSTEPEENGSTDTGVQENETPRRGTNSTTDQNGEVPNTGPGDMLAIFAATTIIATLGYSVVQKQNS